MASVLYLKVLGRNETISISVLAMEENCAILWDVDKTARKEREKCSLSLHTPIVKQLWNVVTFVEITTKTSFTFKIEFRPSFLNVLLALVFLGSTTIIVSYFQFWRLLWELPMKVRGSGQWEGFFKRMKTMC